MATSDINRALRRIRILRYVAFGLFVAFLPFTGIFESVMRNATTTTVVAIATYVCLVALTTMASAFSTCPRCHKPFFITWRTHPLASQCVHCGLPISGE